MINHASGSDWTGGGLSLFRRVTSECFVSADLMASAGIQDTDPRDKPVSLSDTHLKIECVWNSLKWCQLISPFTSLLRHILSVALPSLFSYRRTRHMEHDVYSGVTALWQIVKSSITKGWWKSWMKWLGSIMVSGEVMALYHKGRDLKRGVRDEWRAGQMMLRLKWTDGREGKVIDKDISKFLSSSCETCGEYIVDCFTDYKTCLIMQAEYKKRRKKTLLQVSSEHNALRFRQRKCHFIHKNCSGLFAEIVI